MHRVSERKTRRRTERESAFGPSPRDGFTVFAGRDRAGGPAAPPVFQHQPEITGVGVPPITPERALSRPTDAAPLQLKRKKKKFTGKKMSLGEFLAMHSSEEAEQSDEESLSASSSDEADFAPGYESGYESGDESGDESLDGYGSDLDWESDSEDEPDYFDEADEHAEAFDRRYSHSKQVKARAKPVAGPKDLNFWRKLPRSRDGNVPRALDQQVSHYAEHVKYRMEHGFVDTRASRKSTAGVRLRGRGRKKMGYGKTFFGTSGGLVDGMQSLPKVERRWRGPPREKWSFQNCAEEECVSNLHHHIKRRGQKSSRIGVDHLEIASVHTVDGAPYPQCRNCQHVFKGAHSLTEENGPAARRVHKQPKQGHRIRRRLKAHRIARARDRDRKYAFLHPIPEEEPLTDTEQEQETDTEEMEDDKEESGDEEDLEHDE